MDASWVLMRCDTLSRPPCQDNGAQRWRTLLSNSLQDIIVQHQHPCGLLEMMPPLHADSQGARQ